MKYISNDPGNPYLAELQRLNDRKSRSQTLSVQDIDDVLKSIECAEADENWDVVNSLLPKVQVVLLADIAKKLDNLTRIVLSDFQTKP